MPPITKALCRALVSIERLPNSSAQVVYANQFYASQTVRKPNRLGSQAMLLLFLGFVLCLLLPPKFPKDKTQTLHLWWSQMAE
ncbi:hypothetical protein GDO86_015126 [Hymenochirus boettgeri]|uniref:Uncharacterized protein n=1 Tax=Hymenochirus boettgeri TaxID=247094 RepID=A0A8T2JU77_9PIPI|nr:hypothetical protein GDO86_015126 [Hymenochirus boettgeri]